MDAVLGVADMWAAASGREQLAVVCLGVALWQLVDWMDKQHERWAHPQAHKGTDTPAGFIIRAFLTALMDLARAIAVLFDVNTLLEAAAVAEAEYRASQAAAASERRRQGAAAQATEDIPLMIERAPASRVAQPAAEAVMPAAAANDDEVQSATGDGDDDAASADNGTIQTDNGLIQSGVSLAVRSLRLHASGLNLASPQPPFMPISRRVAAVAAAAASSGAGNGSDSSSMQAEQLRLHLGTAGGQALTTPAPFSAGSWTGLLRRSNARAAAAAADSSWLDDLSRAAANLKADRTWLHALNSVAASRLGVSAQQQLDDAEEAVAEDWPQGQQEQERAEQERAEQERAHQERVEQERMEQERVEQERAEQERVKQERAEHERIKQERAEQERVEQERAEQERAVPCTRDPQVQIRGSSWLSLVLREKLAADAVPAPAVVAPAPAVAARDDGVRHLLPSWLLERVS